MRILRKTVQIFFDEEQEAKNYIEQMDLEGGELTKHSIEYKSKKSKGEIVAEGFVLTTQTDFGKPFDDYVAPPKPKKSKED